jgi:glycine hydroxymethyltransferase
MNKNTVPFDPRPPFDPSGIRMGTPALTTRGLKEAEMERVANWIDAAITGRSDEAKLAKIKAEIVDFSKAYPLPQ